jgi:hypothetical protein
MLINKISGHIPQHKSCAFVLEMHYLEIKIDLDIVIVMPIKLTWKCSEAKISKETKRHGKAHY